MFRIFAVLILVAFVSQPIFASTQVSLENSKILSSRVPIEANTSAAFVVEKILALEQVVAKMNANTDAAKNSKLEQELRTLVSAILDLNVLGRAALRTHWDKVSKPQQQKYLSLFQRVIEQNYLEKARQYVGGSYKLVLDRVQKDKGFETVRLVVKQKEVDVIVELLVHKNASGFSVHDIRLDDTSLEATYRSDFNRIIRKEGGVKTGLPVLISRMEKRLQDIRDGKATRL